MTYNNINYENIYYVKKGESSEYEEGYYFSDETESFYNDKPYHTFEECFDTYTNYCKYLRVKL